MSKYGLATWSHRITDFGGQDEVERHAERLAEAGFDLLIPCVKKPPGYADFLTDVADVNPDYPDWDPLARLIEACGERGVKVHPWFCVFTEGQNSKLLRENPEFEAKFESSRRWACACRQEVQDYLFRLYRSIAERYKPDGLHLDYIRTGGICKCEFCKSDLLDLGINIEDLEFRNPDFDRWMEWRVERLKGFVRRIRELTSQLGMELSAAVFPGYPDCIYAQAQDWAEWAHEGLVDFLFPMNYTNSVRIARGRAVSHTALVKGKVPVWEGLGKSSSASQLSTEMLRRQVEVCLQAGAEGIVLFSYPAVTDEDIEVLKPLLGK